MLWNPTIEKWYTLRKLSGFQVSKMLASGVFAVSDRRAVVPRI